MRKAFFGPVYLFLLPTAIYSQKIDSALKEYRKEFPAEKIYIQYNKQHYSAGETIWFKAYLMLNNQPSGVSNNFYLQLSNENGKVISNKKYPVKGATVTGRLLTYVTKTLNNKPHYRLYKPAGRFTHSDVI